MIICGNTLIGLATTILRIAGRDEHSKTMDNILKVYYRPAKDEIFLARWTQEEDTVLIKTYDRSVKGWSLMAVAQDIVESVRSAGIELEVVWDA